MNRDELGAWQCKEIMDRPPNPLLRRHSIWKSQPFQAWGILAVYSAATSPGQLIGLTGLFQCINRW